MIYLDHILLAWDSSPGAEAAAALALSLTERTGATLHVLFVDVPHVNSYDPRTPDLHTPEALWAYHRQTFEATAAPFDLDALTIEHAMTASLTAAPAVLDYAHRHDIDLIVMGTHGRRGLRALLLGSVAQAVINGAVCPVLAVRHVLREEGAVPAIRRLLVPLDFSVPSLHTLAYARSLAALYDVPIDVLHVLDPVLNERFQQTGWKHRDGVVQALKSEALRQLEAQVETTVQQTEADVSCHVVVGDPARQIVAWAQARPGSLTAMARSGHPRANRLSLGRVTDHVVRTAPCPVFITNPSGHRHGEAEPETRAALPGP